MIPIKTPSQIEAMRRSCRVTRAALEKLCARIRPGVTTGEIDRWAGEIIRATGGVSAFHGYKKFPGQVCVSVNEEVVHGIGGPRVVNYGDLVKIDMGIILNGWVGDTAITVAVGAVGPEEEKLMRVTLEALRLGVAAAAPGNTVGDISAAVERCVRAAGYSVVKEFAGHGVGRNLHEDPQVPNYGKAGSGPRLKPGMILAIEPMVVVGRSKIEILPDGWTVVSADRTLSAHSEHTVLVTRDGPEILTLPPAAVAKLESPSAPALAGVR